MTQKRISPAPMGRAYRIRKRSNHVTIIVASKEKKAKAAPKAKSAKAERPAKPAPKAPAAETK
jgi:large subunit ribosomal protein L22